MYKDYGKVYNVKIDFNEKLSKTEIDELVEEFFSQDEIIKLEGRQLEVVWEVPENEGVHEIENSLFYILEDGDLGTYTNEYIR